MWVSGGNTKKKIWKHKTLCVIFANTKYGMTEKEIIKQALKNNPNKGYRDIAPLLGIGVTTLVERIKEYGLPRRKVGPKHGNKRKQAQQLA